MIHLKSIIPNSAADDSVPVSPGMGNCSKVDRNGRRSGRPTSKVLLK